MSQTEVQLIKDAVIVNADISNSAAIDVSKISGAMPLAGGSFTDDVTFTGASANIVFDKSDNALEFNDDAKATFGSSADTTFTHSGADFAITNTTGNLNILNNSADAVQIRHGNETMIKAISDGAVELYHDNTKTFETTAEGAKFDTGSSSCVVRLNSNSDAESILQAFGNDFLLKAPSGGGVFLNTNSNESAINCIANGAVELYHNNSKKFETTSSGATVTGLLNIPDGSASGNRIALGTGNDLRIYHDSSNSVIDNQTGYLVVQSSASGAALYLQGAVVQAQPAGGGEIYFEGNQNGAFEAYYDNSKKFETTSSGIQVTGQVYTDTAHVNGELDLVGNLDLNSDSHKIKLGAGDDFQFYHDGSNNYITTNNGDIIMQTSGDDIQLLAEDDIILKVQGGVETAINCSSNGAVDLYHNNSKKFETLSDGVNVTGTLKVNGSPFTGGKILQVVAAETTNSASTSSSSFVDTNITANITPSSTSSKVLVMIDAPFHVIRSNGTSNSFEVKVQRNGSDITDTITSQSSTHQSGIGSGAISSNRSVGVLNKIILDSPSSTSQLTYKMTMGGAFSGNTVTFQDGCKSHITLMEVAA